ncbi:MAG: hypothetical protein J1F02_10095 [Lachnospiraceae bacterium]|nr:hypothetical protein [Lachnospiraceae bacterium]
MLRKCIKHEWLATARSFLPMFAFIIILTPIFSIIMKLNISEDIMVLNFFKPMGIFGFIVMIIAIYIATFIFVITRFYRTTATSEAYLTFTLPVSTHHILLSKWLVAVFWQVIAAILAICSILAMTFITEVWTPSEALHFIEDIFSFAVKDTSIIKWMLLFGLSLLIQSAAGTLQFYCSIILGQLVRNHRILASIGIYMAIYVALQFIGMLFLMPLFLFNIDDYYTITIYISIIENVLLSGVFYFVTAWVMKKHLNVQ